ncbi:MAG TPA: NUDIX domain-containing protein [Terriglobales bacterium]|nr:NUDIX domain-containing protein [Terriglobales bacterium]
MTAMSSSASLRSLLSPSVRDAGRLRVRQRRKAQPREQVAAVCYRIHNDRLEILLVQTRRSGRWIFPKGGVEPGLTRSQSAALEALEEAGVHGSIEEAPFAEYAIPQSGAQRGSRSESTIAAYLCAVTWLTSPHEVNRNPTWFSPEKAKKQMSRSRERRSARELCWVVDRAVMRVERLQSCDFKANDPLRRTDFESPTAQVGYGSWHASPKPRTMPNLLRAVRQSVVVDVRPLAARGILQLGSAPDPARGMQFVPRPAGQNHERGQRKKSGTARTFRS